MCDLSQAEIFNIRNDSLRSIEDSENNQGFIKNGSYGSVQRFIWIDKECAVKYFRKRDNYAKNLAEVANLHICLHPNIVRLFGAGPDLKAHELHFYVMEFAPNGSLDELLHEQLSVEYDLVQGLYWIYQCTKAVEYLHTNFKHPILHRDIKPANLLLFDVGRIVKLCDFGTVKSVQQMENTAESGTFLYMAPEVMNSVKDRKASYNEKCDIYSIAIVLWEVITRQKPFKNAPNVFSIIATVVIKKERLEDIPNCPSRLEKLIKSCWKDQFKERPDIGNVVKALDMIIKHLPKPKPLKSLRTYSLSEQRIVACDTFKEPDDIQYDECFQVMLNNIDDNLKPRDPLKDNQESKIIHDQHTLLLKRYVYLNLDCQQLEYQNNQILFSLSNDGKERDRIKRYCELKIKDEQIRSTTNG